jgi:AcrR family transcriptional regulator
MENCTKKLQKRKAIAQSCSILLQSEQYHNISISRLASTAGIGKGTIYEYFKNKEDIVFELMTCMQEVYDEKLELLLQKSTTLEEKLNSLFMLFLLDDESIIKQRDIYKQFLTICISNPSDEIKKYNTNIRDKYINILNNIINNKEISTNIYDYVILCFLNSITLNHFDLKINIQNYLKNQITIINKKGSK